MRSLNTFLSSKLSVHFRHWKEVEVIDNDYFISKRIYTFLTMKRHISHNWISENKKKSETEWEST